MDKNFIWQVGEYIAEGHTISEAALYFQKSQYEQMLLQKGI